MYNLNFQSHFYYVFKTPFQLNTVTVQLNTNNTDNIP